MRILLQKVKTASVSIDEKVIGKINHGLLIFLGIAHEDSTIDADWLVEKIMKLRLFSDPEQDSFMEKNIVEAGGSLLIVSQFTLYGDCKKGTRPSFTKAAPPEEANRLYEYVIQKCKEMGMKTEAGRFGSYMDVTLVNDGPVTLLLDSK